MYFLSILRCVEGEAAFYRREREAGWPGGGLKRMEESEGGGVK
jgi:hypothetical protein